MKTNVCIDQQFTVTDSSKMRQIITGNCGFNEAEYNDGGEIGRCQNEEIQNTKKSLEYCQSKTLFSDTALMKLDAELKAAIIAKVQCESTLKFAQNVNSKSEETENIYDLKNRKISELMSEVENKNQKLISNLAEIKRLNDKVEMLSKP